MSNFNTKTFIIALGNNHETINVLSKLTKSGDHDNYIILVRDVFYNKYHQLLKEFNFQYKIFSPLSFISNSTAESTNKINFFLNEINQLKLKQVINLTPSKVACYIASLIKVEIKKGPRYNLSAEIAIRDQWSQYLYVSYLTSTSPTHSFSNLAQRILGTQINKIKQYNSESFILLDFDYNQKSRINIQTTSELIYKILKTYPNRQFKIVSNHLNANEIQKLLKIEYVDFFRKRLKVITEQNLINEIKLSEITVSDKRETIAIADFYNKKSIECFNNNFELINFNTNNDNSIAICPQLDINIDYHALIKITMSFIEHNVNYITTDSDYSFNKYRVLSHTYQHGFPISTDLNHKVATSETYIQHLSSYILPLAIDGIEHKIIPVSSANLKNEIVNLKYGMQLIYELLQHSSIACSKILSEIDSNSPKTSKIKNNLNRLNEIDQLLSDLSTRFPEISTLIQFTLIQLKNIESNNVIQLAQKQLIQGEFLKNVISAYYEIMDNNSIKTNQRESNA